MDVAGCEIHPEKPQRNDSFPDEWCKDDEKEEPPMVEEEKGEPAIASRHNKITTKDVGKTTKNTCTSYSRYNKKQKKTKHNLHVIFPLKKKNLHVLYPYQI